jgi:heat shock protein HtpX
MPFTHVEIKERKSKEIALLFVFLIFLYVVSILILFFGSRLILEFKSLPKYQETVTILVLAIAAAAIHWLLSTNNMIGKVLEAVDAKALDERDTYHARLRNIVDEVSIATGGMRIEAYVIPTPALNACAISDFNGRSAIAVTEGLLAKLDRAQLESVIGHEAAHIVGGDSLSNTMLAALFALHEDMFRGISRLMQSRTRIQGNVGVLIMFVYVVTRATYMIKTMCNFCISRQKEYRADASSVQLTRNPLSLAEALDLISMKWRGVGMKGESLSSIFIVDPGTELLSDEEGFFADWFATHPPVESRINFLLGMAHISLNEFEKTADEAFRRKREKPLPSPSEFKQIEPGAKWMLWDDKALAWNGPFEKDMLLWVKTFLPDSWVKRLDEETAKPAYQDSILVEAFRKRYGAIEGKPSAMECPICHVGLLEMLYEGAPLQECPACHGAYVDPQIVSRIFAREEYGFPEPVKRLGDMLLSEKNQAEVYKSYQQGAKPLKDRKCPRCGAGVVRKFYSEAYLVEVDQCFSCALTWLDSEELELLQYIYEKRQNKREADRREVA